MPPKWALLYRRLPNKRREDGWEPALPLILGAWHDTPDFLKMERLVEHIEWAELQGCLDEIATYLRNLREEEWYHMVGCPDWEC
jgi:hypothetical protein